MFKEIYKLMITGKQVKGMMLSSNKVIKVRKIKKNCNKNVRLKEEGIVNNNLDIMQLEQQQKQIGITSIPTKNTYIDLDVQEEITGEEDMEENADQIHDQRRQVIVT